MKNIILSIVVLILFITTLGCPPIKKKEPLAPERATHVRRTISTWLESEECMEGTLEAVVELGEAAVPSLAAVLREGPSPANLEQLRLHLIANYQKLKEYQETHRDAQVPMSQKMYVNTYLDNYIALNQSRAAIALGKIGGEDAKKALEQALKAPLRKDVINVVADSWRKVQ